MQKSEVIAIANTAQALRSGIAQAMPDNPVLSGWAAFSQFDEDGIIRECLRRIAAKTPLTKTFVEIGCADGLENNTHLLLLDGFRGVWIDGSKDRISAIDSCLGGTIFATLWINEAKVYLESAGLLAQRAGRFLGETSIDFLSLDIDGNDLHVLPSFVSELDPKLVCVEYNAKFPPPIRQVMRYNENHTWEGTDYFGASLQAWVDEMKELGYSLVSCNLSGVNAFFVRSDLSEGFTAYTTEELYQPPRYFLTEGPRGHRATLRWAKQFLDDAVGEKFRLALANGSEFPAFRFAIHTGVDQYISGDIARDGVWEPFETKVFSRLCRPGDTVLDLGANIGWYSVVAAKILGDTGHVLAFEPDEANARLLEFNTAIADLHGIVEIFRSAVGDRQMEALLFKSDSNLGDHRLFSDGTARESYSVHVSTLDEILSGEDQNLPNIMKSDTQGSEAKILRGAAGLFSKGWRPIMILEFWPFGLTHSGDDPKELWLRIVGLGYLTFEVSERSPVLMPVTEEWLDSLLAGDISPSSQGFINLLCLPEGSPRFDCLTDLFHETKEF